MALATYTEEQKTRALELLETESVWAATTEIGCSHQTVYRWYAEHVQTLKQSDEDLEAETLRQATLRTYLRKRLLETALAHVDRSDHTRSAKDAREYMTAAAIAIDKFRLEMGEHTDRTSHLGQWDMEMERIMDEWKRQQPTPSET